MKPTAQEILACLAMIMMGGLSGVLVFHAVPQQNTELVTCTPGAFPVAAPTKLDWYIDYAVSGHTTLYAAGVQICDYAGDITTNELVTFALGAISGALTVGGGSKVADKLTTSTGPGATIQSEGHTE